jgi:ADP-ribosyl-[dinitrogen reductase] hydrolase
MKLDGLQHLDCVLDDLPVSAPPFEEGAVVADRVRGMLLGLAIGDALGNTTEGQLPERRRSERGHISDYLANKYAEHRKAGLPSDDTQLAFWTLEALLEDEDLDAANLAAAFCGRHIYGIGHTIRGFSKAMANGLPWWEASQKSAGNGALMRIAPVILPYVGTPSPELWKRAALFAGTTHNDPANIACCVGFVKLLCDLLVATKPPQSNWWLDTFEKIACPVEGETQYEPRGGEWQGKYIGPLTKFAVEKSREALENGLDTGQFGQQVFSGAYLMETMPMVLFILAKWGHDPEQAIITAVNDTKDNDTIAAIVGAAVGALHGEEALPMHWRDNLLGRLGHDDDGRVQTMLDAGCDRWVKPTVLSASTSEAAYSTTTEGHEGPASKMTNRQRLKNDENHSLAHFRD